MRRLLILYLQPIRFDNESVNCRLLVLELAQGLTKRIVGSRDENAHAQKISSSQRSRCLLLTKGIVSSEVENVTSSITLFTVGI